MFNDKIFRTVALGFFFIFFLTVNSSLAVGAADEENAGSRENPFLFTSTTPLFEWDEIPEAELYAVYINRYPYGSGNLIYENKELKAASFEMPEGYLIDGGRYCCNIMVREESGWKNHFELFYFQIKLDNPTARDWYLRGNDAFEREEYDTALNCYTKLIEMEPELSEAYYTRGTVYGAKKEYQKAIADFNRAIMIDPDYAQPYYGRAIVYSSLQEYNKALTDITKAQTLGFPVNSELVELLIKITGGS